MGVFEMSSSLIIKSHLYLSINVGFGFPLCVSSSFAFMEELGSNNIFFYYLTTSRAKEFSSGSEVVIF